MEKNGVKCTAVHVIIYSSTLQDPNVKRARYINPQVLSVEQMLKKE